MPPGNSSTARSPRIPACPCIRSRGLWPERSRDAPQEKTRAGREDGLMRRYILVGQTPVPEPNLERWADWMGDYDEHVAFESVGHYHVSTIFLGFDHAHAGS